jgi:hypothetical protein
MSAVLVSGKTCRKARKELGLTQPKFAKWLSKQTGIPFETQTICRMETYGTKKACHPIPPPPEVVAIISSHFPQLLKKNIYKEVNP